MSRRSVPVFSTATRVAGFLCFLTLLSGSAAPLMAGEPWIRASVTGLETGCYRIALGVHAPEWEGAVPTGADVMSSVSLFEMRGTWPVPTNVLPAGLHHLLEIAAGDIVWGADWLAPALESGFDLTVDTASVRVDYSCILEYFLHTQSSDGRDRFDFLGAQSAAGILEAPLPGPGETTWFSPVISPVNATTWSGVKELFRAR